MPGLLFESQSQRFVAILEGKDNINLRPVCARLLKDDSRQHCELGVVTYSRGDKAETLVTLEDMAP